MKNLQRRVNLFSNIKLHVLFVSSVLFLISLSLNCYCTELGERHFGFSELLTGWTGLYLGGPMLTWLANPCLFIAWRTFKGSNKISLIFSVLASIGSLAFLFFPSIYEIDEGVNTIVQYQLGYWLWLASSLVMLIANTIVYANSKNINTTWFISSVLMIVIVTLILGMSRTKQITFSAPGYEVAYAFRGNLDTTASGYKISRLKSILLTCNSFIAEKDTITANEIINFYYRFGKSLNSTELNGKQYPTIDTIIKYRNKIFDTTTFAKITK